MAPRLRGGLARLNQGGDLISGGAKGGLIVKIEIDSDRFELYQQVEVAMRRIEVRSQSGPEDRQTAHVMGAADFYDLRLLRLMNSCTCLSLA